MIVVAVAAIAAVVAVDFVVASVAVAGHCFGICC